MYTVTTAQGSRTEATLRIAWAMAIYDDGSITLTKSDEDATQTFDDYAAFTTYVEENA